MTVCLDSWAVLRWLEGSEPAAARVEAALSSSSLSQRPIMSWINVGEVFYIVARQAGMDEAHDVAAGLRRQLRLELPTDERVLQAAAIKAVYPLALADAFAVATARANGAVLWTGDPEILDADAEWPTLDLRG